jgi:hypothetical protein
VELGLLLCQTEGAAYYRCLSCSSALSSSSLNIFTTLSFSIFTSHFHQTQSNMPPPQLPASAPQSPVVEKPIRHASSATTLHLPISQQDSSDTAIRELPLTKEVFETALAMKKDAADASMNVLETSVSTDPTLTDAEAQAATYLLMKWDELREF